MPRMQRHCLPLSRRSLSEPNRTHRPACVPGSQPSHGAVYGVVHRAVHRSVYGTALRSGFVLLAVLWVMVGVSVLGLALSLSARHAIRAAENRRAGERAAWMAEGCVERARAVIDGVLTGSAATTNTGPYDARGGWHTLDRVLAGSPLMMSNDCVVSLRAAGSTIDVNSASEELLHRFFVALGVPAPRADSLTQALLDWRDPDGLARPLGAEREWYERAGGALPRNGPLENARELADIRGFRTIPGVDSMLDVEPGRIDLGHAPLPVLAALPGFTSEAVARVAEQRLRGVAVGNVLSLGARLSPRSRVLLLERYAELARLTVTEPDAWLLTGRAAVGQPRVIAVVELRLVRAGKRAAVVRRRSWTE